VIPEDANPAKVAATRAFGAEVIQEGVNFANRDQRARQVAGKHGGLVLVHPYDNWDVIHGQGTAAREVFTADPHIRTIVTPCGGGGLLSGTALWARHHDARTRVIGVEPERAADAKRTLESRAIYSLPRSPETIADGVRTVSIGERNFEVLGEQRLVDEIVTVSEEQIGQATRIAWLRLKLALEPTAALPLAAYLNGLIPDQGPTCLILTGGNADQRLVARLLGQP
jgi:threonine dehydratase